MLVMPLDRICPEHAPFVGGKALSLATLAQTGMVVPDGMAVTTTAYHEYLAASGIQNQIRRELTWRPVDQMRWEEMWDASLRIRNAFLKASMPAGVRRTLLRALRRRFGGKAVAVRSSAPGEDSADQSFAGLHESYLNIRDAEDILEHIRLVWASLWSDAALLYRKELGLDIEKSAMAVLVQEFVPGSRSGVAFGRHPMRPECVAVEAVHGLNQGLVDGTVEPDRWTLDGRTGEVLEHHAAERSAYVSLSRNGVTVRPLPTARAARAPLSDRDVRRVFMKAVDLGECFKRPQDVEWTFRGSRLYLLQSRAITTAETGEGDKRAWYLSLRRSVDNLLELRGRIENDLIPKMDAEARRWQKANVGALSDEALLAELARRYDRYQAWLDRYWDECIPFAHGVRLFGQFYNDVMKPSDPYEFVGLLSGTGLLSVQRNDALQLLAAQVRASQKLRMALEGGDVGVGHRAFWAAVDKLGAEFAPGPNAGETVHQTRRTIAALLLQMAERALMPPPSAARGKRELERAFLAKYRGKKRKEAKELLELGRASYRLRDDDNLYLGRVARQVEVAQDEAKRRKLKVSKRFEGNLAMRPTGGQQHAAKDTVRESPDFSVRARQLIGQPAGPGFASGTARVIRTAEELFTFQAGEVLVCDAVDPNMTFVMPLAGGIVECRGGMLVHGAIIAREYGIPCVTGVAKAMSMIATGDHVQVDGYSGVVTIG
jgi:rifampicin phosphotransferase